MITLLLLEDDPRDAEKIKNALETFDEHILKITTTLADATKYLQENPKPDAILLDLEMKAERTTSLHLLDQIDESVPVIVISNLLHYQKSSLRHKNVRDFISKVHLDSRLSDCLSRVLVPKSNFKPVSIIFPACKSTHIAESVSIHKIVFMELIGRNEYTIYTSDGHLLTIKTLSFKELLSYLQAKHADSLRPVSRNEIININHISRIGRNASGRIELTLIGYPNRPFHPGKQWVQFFEDEFL